MEIDYSKFVNRLTSFNNIGWPPECPVFIKDFVEAGFTYTGESDLVFCYQCGITVDNWKEDDNALKKHELLSRDCLFLQKRLLALCNGTVGPSHEIRETETFVYEKGKGVVKKSERNSSTTINRCDGVLRSISEIQQDPDDGDRLANESMRSEEKRLDSFITCPVNKEWPSPDKLSKNGFYWSDNTNSMYCFCCGCEVNNWEMRDQDVKQKHWSLSKSCRFVNDLLCGNIEMRDDAELDISMSKLNIKHGYADTLPTPNVVVTTVTFSRPDSRTYAPIESTSPSVLSPSDVSMYYTSSDNKYSFQVSVQNSPLRMHSQSLSLPSSDLPLRMHSECLPPQPSDLPHDLRRSQSYPPKQENILLNGTVVASGQIDLSNNSTRLKTFLTYPKTAELQPVELAEAGFYYINREDCVRCYKCNVMLGEWMKGDTAWNEHCKFSPNCVLVKERLQGNRVHTQQQVQHQQLQPYYNQADSIDPRFIQKYPSTSSPSEQLYNYPQYPRNMTPQRQVSEQYYKQYSQSEYTDGDLNKSWPNNTGPIMQGYYQDGYDRQSSLNKSPVYIPNNFNQAPRQENAYGYDQPPSINKSPVHMHSNLHQQHHQESSYGYGRQPSSVNKSPVHTANSPHQMYRHESSYGYDRQPSLNKSPIHMSNNHHQMHHQESSYRHDNHQPPLIMSPDSPNKMPIHREYNRNGGSSDYYQNKPENKFSTSEYLKLSDQLIFQDHNDPPLHNLHEFERPILEDTSQVHKGEVDQRYERNVSPSCLKSASHETHMAHMGNDLDQHIRNTHEEGTRNNYQKLRSPDENVQLQTIFKIPEDGDEDDMKQCKICMDASIEMTFVPCGHLVVCQSCAHGLSMCPICRKDVTNSLRTYFYGN